ncbi:hypothetical protein SAY86_027763 [Trapa natans]|uniref:glycerophosphodiester phosphodiesterase n=1 Tax=Trapa natans TaxID=22666 RepID=A0AAN7KSB6_TRANT|nr:hypothetical protein SAY86_027763 [Trapa natans]
MAMTTSKGDIVMYCDLQLTKDGGVGICQPDITLNNTTDIGMVFPSGKKTYNVNGKPVQVVQNVLSRSSLFDRTMQVQSVDDILGRKSVKLLWLNVQHDLFYNEQKHSPSAYVHKVVRYYPLDYISSPEIGFLKAMQGKAYASGILVPKDYIWPVSTDKYLAGNPSTLVPGAHKLGLEVYASSFSNDFPASYNYSYDPTLEYLQFVDSSSQFVVDG